MEEQASEKPGYKKGYGKRPIWFWIVVYLVVAVVAYFLIYYFFFRGGGSTLIKY